MEGFENVIFHEAFYEKSKGVEQLKNIMEFNFPDDAKEHYNALNGFKYRELVTIIESEISDAVKAAHGTPEAEYLNPVLKRIHDLAVALDVKVKRK